MADAGIALQKAIYTVLSTSLSVPVYDHVPQDSAYPYVSIDSQESSENDFLDSPFDERYVYLSIWSQYRGQKEVQEIIGQITDALHGARLDMETGCIVLLKVARKSSSTDTDGLTYMGSVTLYAMIDY